MTKLTLIITSLVACFIHNTLAADNITSRSHTSCGYVGGQIYCYGGDSSPTIATGRVVEEDLYSLDINSFGGQKTYTMGSQWNKIVPVVEFITENRGTPSSVVLSDGKRFLIQGGYNTYGFGYANQTIIYDTSSNTWSSDTQFKYEKGGERQVYRTAAVSLPNNSVVFYGGYNQFSYSSANVTYSENYGENVGFDRLMMLAVESGTWSPFSPQISVLTEFYPNSQMTTFNPSTGKIYYLGGSYSPFVNNTRSSGIPFSWALIFNTNSGMWSNETLHGEIPSNRMDSTVNLLPNSQDIILYGGVNTGVNPLDDYCYTLNLETNTWTFHNNVGVPIEMSGPRYSHSAVLVDVTLFILFGRGNTGILGFPVVTINVSNASNIMYVDIYDPPISKIIDIDSKESRGLSKGAIGGIIAGSFIAGLIIVAFIVFQFRRRKSLKRQDSHEDMTVDWDAIEDYYKDPATKRNLPHSAETTTNNNSLSRSIDKNPPDVAVHAIKPSINSKGDYTAVKPDVK